MGLTPRDGGAAVDAVPAVHVACADAGGTGIIGLRQQPWGCDPAGSPDCAAWVVLTPAVSVHSRGGDHADVVVRGCALDGQVGAELVELSEEPLEVGVSGLNPRVERLSLVVGLLREIHDAL